MRAKLIIGYVTGILGFIMLIWNAYIYFSQSDLNGVSSVGGILLCIIGAVMIKKNRE